MPNNMSPTIAAFVLLTFTVAGAYAKHSQDKQVMSMTKMVPEAATIEYRVSGQLVQSLSIKPGTYQITVKQLH